MADEHSRWQKLENNPACVVWNLYPEEQEMVTWNGACANGKAQGHGTLMWRYVEDGEWKDFRYEGDFKDGKRDGRGKSKSEYGVYDGDWKDSKANGRGIWVEANGNRYEGEFKGDKFHGRGVMVWADGGRFEGDWENNKPHGRGTYYFANGDKCEGDWWDNRLLGTGRGWAEGRQMKCYQGGNGFQFTD